MSDPGMLEKVNKKLPVKITAPRVIGGLVVVGGLALAMPLIWTAAIGGAGLLVLAALGGAAILAMNAVPLVLQKWDNRILEARKNEARRNPIATRQNIAIARREELNKANSMSANIETAIKRGKKELANYRAEFSDETYAKEIEEGIKLSEDALAKIRANIEKGTEALVQYEGRTKMLEGRLKLALSVGSIHSLLNPNRIQNVYDKLLSETATQEVDDMFENNMSELRATMSQIELDERLQQKASPEKLKQKVGGSDFPPLEV